MTNTTESRSISGSTGGKGGGKSHTPVEFPNDLQSRSTARILDLVSEGEIEGLFDSTHPLKSIYFDDVPIMNADESLNYEGVAMVERVGTPTQTPIPGFSAVETEITVNEKMTTISPVIESISDTDVDAIRIKVRIPSLYQQQSNGDLTGTTVNYLIEVQPNGGSYATVLDETLTGKTSGPFEQQHRVELSSYAYPINVRMSRVTADSGAATLQNQVFWNSYTEIQEINLIYGDSAYYSLTLNSELFSGGIPRRSFDIKGIKIQHPSNYDPDTRVYTGIWDGTFITAYCNNPAWVFFDLLTNKRYGLGEKLTAAQVDKYALYTIGQYCDELVPDGFGGTEPRFETNGVIATRREAYTVVNAFASMFRGLTYWSAGGVSVSQDSPTDPVRVVTEANVLNGTFSYSGTGLKARKSAAAVSWNDPVDNYKQALEVIEDPAQINLYGLKTAKTQAFMCTSQGLARRLGKWILDSQRHETQTVTFTAGFDFADARPGEIIQIADRAMQNARLGGRVVSFNYNDVRPDTVADETFAKDTTFSSVAAWSPSTNSIDRNNHAVFHARIKVPSSVVPVGCLMEAGKDLGSGMYVGFDGSGDLIYRAGDGAASPDVNDSARIVVAYADIPKDRGIDIVWDVKVNNASRAGLIRLWINNQFIAEKSTADGTDFLSNEFAGSNDGAYGKVSVGGTVAGESGNFSNDLEDCGITIESDLSYWRNGLVTTFLSDETETDGFVENENITTVTTYTGAGSGEFERDANGILACSVTMPTAGTVPQGCIFEFGNGSLSTEESLYLGFDDNGDLVVHAGKGGADPITETEHARIRIPASEFLPSTRHNFIVDVQPDSGLIRLWIDFALRGTAQTSDQTAFQNGQSADAGTGSYGQVVGSTIVGTSFALDFNGTLDSELTYFNDAIVGDVTGSYNVGTITLDAPYEAQDDDRLLLITEDGNLDSLEIRGGTTGTTVELLTNPTRTANADYDTMFLIQGAVTPTEWRILSFREAEGHQFEITALEHDNNKYDRIENDLVIDARPTSFFPTGPLAAPTELTIIENLYLSNGTVKTRVDISWLASTDPRVALYRVEVKPPDGQYYVLSTDSVATAQILDAQDGLWSFRIRAIMGSNKPSSSVVLESIDYVILGKSLPPEDVTGFTATRDYATVSLSWTRVTDLDLAGYVVKQGASYDSGTTITDTFIGTSLEVPLFSAAAVSYHIKSIDVVGNLSTGATRVDTVSPTVPAITGFNAYQIGRDVFLTWNPLDTVSSIRYEVRVGTTSGTWETSELFGITETPQSQKKKSVNAMTTFRFRIKPYVQFLSDVRQYGAETTTDIILYPVVGNAPTKTQTEETAWTGRTGIVPTATADETIADGGAINSAYAYTASGSPPNMGRSQNAVMRITVKVPTAVTPLGTIWEMGNTNDGGLVCFDGNQDLVVRAGDGAGSWNVNHIARVVIPNASIPSNVDFDLMWDIRCDGANSGRVRVWIDGFLVGEDATDDASQFQSGVWSATNDGQVDGNNGSLPTGEAGAHGQDVTASGVLLQSSMDYWADTLVADGMEITASNEMALKAGEIYGEYIYDFDHASLVFGNVWLEEVSLFLSANPLEIFEASGDIFDATYPITELINGAGIPQIQFYVQLDGTGDFIPFQEADYSFTTAKIKIQFRRNTNDSFRPALSNLSTYQNVPTFML